jgi:hypothetical protein
MLAADQQAMIDAHELAMIDADEHAISTEELAMAAGIQRCNERGNEFMAACHERLAGCQKRDELLLAAHEIFGSDAWDDMIGDVGDDYSVLSLLGPNILAAVTSTCSRSGGAADDVLAVIQIISSYTIASARGCLFNVLLLTAQVRSRHVVWIHLSEGVPDAAFDWVQSVRDWTTPLHHVSLPHAFPPGRVEALLASGASIHARASEHGSSPLELAALHPDSPPAAVLLQAAQPWSARTHALFPPEARALASALVFSVCQIHACHLGARIAVQDFVHLILRSVVTRE